VYLLCAEHLNISHGARVSTRGPPFPLMCSLCYCVGISHYFSRDAQVNFYLHQVKRLDRTQVLRYGRPLFDPHSEEVKRCRDELVHMDVDLNNGGFCRCDDDNDNYFDAKGLEIGLMVVTSPS
ncbi:hypothetical protein SK128_019519, partial [Halocaridina rubra]